jgi:preprotein translocase subunit SecF
MNEGAEMIKNYKLLLVVPLVIVLFGIGVLVSGFVENGEWFRRSIELRGGTLLTLSTDSDMDINIVKETLSQRFGEVSVKQTRGFSGSGLSIQADASVDPNDILAIMPEMGIDVIDYSSQTIGPALGESFWSQAQLAIIFAFIMMGLVVFILFRKLVPSIAVIMAAVSDMLVTLAVMQVFGIELSLAALAALLMLLGYSIDTNILLTTRLLRSHDTTVMERLKWALKTGLTMTGTTIGALSAVLLFVVSAVLTQIVSVLIIGLVVDLCMTWLQNTTLLRWHMERKGIA